MKAASSRRPSNDLTNIGGTNGGECQTARNNQHLEIASQQQYGPGRCSASWLVGALLWFVAMSRIVFIVKMVSCKRRTALNDRH
ncbi:hypothetical protein [Mesorhizobium sp. M0496]|uniref:hypothetical protein n=1 Tax=Mesorhizobium sp. M0496 TaxID=2956952 RepID=UPI00333B45E0